MTTTYTHAVAFAAMCIMEEMIDSVLGEDAPRPWNEYWNQVGVNEMRSLVLEDLAAHCGAAWAKARDQNDEAFYSGENSAEVPDLGSFDYEFAPVWLRHCVEWPEAAPWFRPRVRNTQILADSLEPEPPVQVRKNFISVADLEDFIAAKGVEALAIDPVRSSDNVVAGKLMCPSCRTSDHLYDRADVRYDPDSGDWVVGDCEGTIDCTECDWTGAERDLVRIEENTHG